MTMLDDRLIISLMAEDLFSHDQGTLGDQAVAALGVLGDALGRFENRVDVNSHAAPTTTAGGAVLPDWEHSIYRALAVADAISSTGYSRSIAALGHGGPGFEELPGNLTAAERQALAQRVDVVIRDIHSMVVSDES